MKITLFILALVSLAVSAYWMACQATTPEKKILVTTPDLRYNDLDKRLKTVEEYLQKKGSHY